MLCAQALHFGSVSCQPHHKDFVERPYGPSHLVTILLSPRPSHPSTIGYLLMECAYLSVELRQCSARESTVETPGAARSRMRSCNGRDGGRIVDFNSRWDF